MYSDVILMRLFSFSIQFMMDYLSRVCTIRIRTISVQSREVSSACHVSRWTPAGLDYLLMMGEDWILSTLTWGTVWKLKTSNAQCWWTTVTTHYIRPWVCTVGLTCGAQNGSGHPWKRLSSTCQVPREPSSPSLGQWWHSWSSKCKGGPSGQWPHKVCHFWYSQQGPYRRAIVEDGSSLLAFDNTLKLLARHIRWYAASAEQVNADFTINYMDVVPFDLSSIVRPPSPGAPRLPSPPVPHRSPAASPHPPTQCRPHVNTDISG